MKGFLSIFLLSTCVASLRATGFGEDNIRGALDVLYRTGPSILPIGDGSYAVRVNIGLSLLKIREVDTSKNEVEVLVWQAMEWSDRRLAWGSSEYSYYSASPENVTQVSIKIDQIWSPDVTLYNAAAAPELLTPSVAMVLRDGSVFHVPGYRYRFTCDLANFTAPQGANCTMKFGSWVYNGFFIDVHSSMDSLDMSEYTVNKDVEVLATSAQREVKHYSCCPEPYPSISFNFTIKKTNQRRGWFS